MPKVTNTRPSVVSDKSEEFWRDFLEQGGDTYEACAGCSSISRLSPGA